MTPQAVRAAQLVYTRIEREYSPVAKSGYQTVYWSAELSQGQRAEIERRVQCFQPFTADVCRYQFFRLDSGLVVLSQSRVIAPWPAFQQVVDKSGRAGPFVAHCLVLSPAAFRAAGGDPLALLGSRAFTADLSAWLMRYGNAAEFRQLHGSDNGVIPAAEIRGAEVAPEDAEWAGEEAQRLLACAQHAEHLRGEGRSLALLGEPSRIMAALRAALAPLTPEQRLRCSFDTCVDRCMVAPGQYWAVGLKDRPAEASFVEVDAARRRVITPVAFPPLVEDEPLAEPPAEMSEPEQATGPLPAPAPALISAPAAPAEPLPAPAPALISAPAAPAEPLPVEPAVAVELRPAPAAPEPITAGAPPARGEPAPAPEAARVVERLEVQPEHAHVVALIDRAMKKSLPLPREAQKDEAGCREFLRVYRERVEGALAETLLATLGSRALSALVWAPVDERLASPIPRLEAASRRSLSDIGLSALVFEALLHERPALQETEWRRLQELAQREQHHGLQFLTAATYRPDPRRAADALQQIPAPVYRRLLERYGTALPPALLVGGPHTGELAGYLEATPRKLSPDEVSDLFEAILRSGNVAPLDRLAQYIPTLDAAGRQRVQRLFVTALPSPAFRRAIDEAVAADRPQGVLGRIFRRG